jgi:hypothetical protein
MPIFLNSSRHHPSSWSTLFADTIGQFVNHTSFQSRGTVVETRSTSSTTAME